MLMWFDGSGFHPNCFSLLTVCCGSQAAGRKPKARPRARQDVPMTQAVSEAAVVLMSLAGF